MRGKIRDGKVILMQFTRKIKLSKKGENVIVLRNHSSARKGEEMSKRNIKKKGFADDKVRKSKGNISVVTSHGRLLILLSSIGKPSLRKY